jgi:hypothetical protein
MQTETTLHPEPLLKGMAWLAERGGPAIRGSGREGRISYRGVEWKWCVTSAGSDFTCGLRGSDQELTGWVSLYAAAQGGVFWRHLKIFSCAPRTDHLGHDLVTIGADGECATVDEAVDMALAWDFDALQLSNGDTLYRTGLNSWQSLGANRIDIRNIGESSRDVLKPWRWSCNCAEIAPLLEFCLSTDLEGRETTREQAIERAAGAVDSFIAACRSFLAKHDADELWLSRMAGKGERA